MQNPVDAEQVRQEEQFWQFPRPSLLNVFVGQDLHASPEVLGCCPTLQLVQAPLLTLQLRQVESQLAQLVVPSEKVPTLHGPQINPFGYDPGLQLKQFPFVLSHVRHELSQAWQALAPPVLKVKAPHESQFCPLGSAPGLQVRQLPVPESQVRQVSEQASHGENPLEN